jgi:SagB-type dehydrogenase family enzyme
MRKPLLLMLSVVLGLLLPISLLAAEPSSPAPKEIVLSKPDTAGGMPLHRALSQRHSVRSFTDQEVGLKEISQILWAANGITRPESGKRTAPSPMATYPARIYLANQEGVYLFDPQGMKLILMGEGDQRSRLSGQKSVLTAPVSLIVVSDTAKMKRTLDERWKGNPENEKLSVLFCAYEGGAIAQNVYLEVTSLGLATVFVGGFNKKEITDLLRLRGEMVLVVMPIGYEAAAK